MIAGCVWVAITISIVAVNAYQIKRDVDAHLYRAQIAADMTDMLVYTKSAKEGLTRHRMTRGHTALIFRTPANDLALLNGTIDRIIERLESMKDVPRNEVTYQVALDDIRGTIREIVSPTYDFLWVKYWFVIVPAILVGCWMAYILLISDERD